MIVTVTFNPAMDVFLKTDKLRPGELNRVTRLSLQPGGKGVNIGYTLTKLGREAVTTGFLGGATGIEFEKRLRDYGVTTNFVHIDRETRSNYIVFEERRRTQTQINEPGPDVSAEEYGRLLEVVGRLLGQARMLVIAGSLPPGIRSEHCVELMELAAAKGVPVCINMIEGGLLPALERRPYIAKPDLRSTRSFLGTSVLNASGRRAVLKALAERAEVAVVSVDLEFSVASAGAAYRVKLPDSGHASIIRLEDAFLAGLIHVLMDEGTLEMATRWGAAAAQTASAVVGGRFESIEDVEANVDRVEVSGIEV